MLTTRRPAGTGSGPPTKCATRANPRSLRESPPRSCRNSAAIAVEPSWSAHRQGAQWRRSGARPISISIQPREAIPAWPTGRPTPSFQLSPRCATMAALHPVRSGLPIGTGSGRSCFKEVWTVHSSNADRIVEAVTSSGAGWAVRKESGRSTGGRPYARTIVADSADSPALECWLVEDAGQAWSGGHFAGTYTDPHGPNASSQTVRFFLEGQE